MDVWTAFVDLFHGALVMLATLFGGNVAVAIIVLSGVIRLALLPLTLRITYRSLEMQAALKRLEPQITRLREKHRNDSRRLFEETAKLYRENGIRLFDRRSALGTLVQIPVFLGLFGAVQRGIANASRFLWVKDLARPDALLVSICAAVAGVAAAFAPAASSPQRSTAIAVAVLLTAVFLWRMAAGVTLHSLTASLVGVVQALLTRRYAARLAASR